MKAFNLKSGKEYFAKKADEYTKRVLSAADYYIDQGSRIILLMPVEEKIDKEMLHRYFEIDGKTFFSTVTNSHDRLVQAYQRTMNRQGRLF